MDKLEVVPWSEGATPLTADEAVDAIVTGDHPQVLAGSVKVDAVLVHMIRKGDVEVARDTEGKLEVRASQQMLDSEVD